MKSRGETTIYFTITSNFNPELKKMQILNLNQFIENNKLNLLQDKYLETVLTNCEKHVEVSNRKELKEWVIVDIFNKQTKEEENFDFKIIMNAISKQIRNGTYSKPYVFPYVMEKEVFDEKIYSEIKELEKKGLHKEILRQFTEDQIKANRFGYVLDSI